MSTMRLFAALVSLLGVLAAAAPARAHGAAVSRFVVSVGEQELAVRANLHYESVLELVEGSHELAHTGEGRAAIERHRPRILSYLHDRLDLRAGGERCVPREPRAYGIAEGELYLRVDLAYDCPKPTTRLSVTSTLFAEVDEPHQIEGEFHAGGLHRVYQFGEVRSSVAIDPSSFRDRPYRGQYIPALSREEDARSQVGSAPKRDDAVVEKRELAPATSTDVTRSDRGEASDRDGAEQRGFVTHAGWYGAALALVVAMWHVQRSLRNARSQRSERGRRKGSRHVSAPVPAPPDDSNQAVSS